LRLCLRRDLAAAIAQPEASPRLSGCGKLAACGIAATALGLLVASASGVDLGAPTLAAGFCTTLLVLLVRRASPLALLRAIHWGVLPLVAGLFVLVEALDRTGATAPLAEFLRQTTTAWGAAASGIALALASNLVNNLPAGLVAASALHQAGGAPDLTAALLIGVDLGPNLSVTGSLATILWLAVLRRENLKIRDRDFLLLGLATMPAALLAALAAARI